MGYRIQYGPPLNSEKKYIKKYKRNLWIACLVIIVFAGLCVAKYTNPELMREFIIPGDAEVTSNAFAQMTEQIRQGAAVKEAFTDFCVEIIEHARIS